MSTSRGEWRWYHVVLLAVLIPAFVYAMASRRDLIDGDPAILVGILGGIFLLFVVAAGLKHLRGGRD